MNIKRKITKIEVLNKKIKWYIINAMQKEGEDNARYYC